MYCYYEARFHLSISYIITSKVPTVKLVLLRLPISPVISIRAALWLHASEAYSFKLSFSRSVKLVLISTAVGLFSNVLELEKPARTTALHRSTERPVVCAALYVRSVCVCNPALFPACEVNPLGINASRDPSSAQTPNPSTCLRRHAAERFEPWLLRTRPWTDVWLHGERHTSRKKCPSTAASSSWLLSGCGSGEHSE